MTGQRCFSSNVLDLWFTQSPLPPPPSSDVTSPSPPYCACAGSVGVVAGAESDCEWAGSAVCGDVWEESRGREACSGRCAGAGTSVEGVEPGCWRAGLPCEACLVLELRCVSVMELASLVLLLAGVGGVVGWRPRLCLRVRGVSGVSAAGVCWWAWCVGGRWAGPDTCMSARRPPCSGEMVTAMTWSTGAQM